MLAQAAVDVPDPVQDVHRQTLIGKAVRIIHPTIVQLADGGDLVALLGEALAPGVRLRADVRRAVVPGFDGVGVAARGEGGPRGYADRGGTVRVAEPGAARGKGVQIGGLDDRVAVAAEHARAVLIRVDEEDVGRSHRKLTSS